MNPPPRPARPILTILIALGLVLGAGAAFAPYLFWEYASLAEPHAIVTPMLVKIARGRMVDDYWSMEEIAILDLPSSRAQTKGDRFHLCRRGT